MSNANLLLIGVLGLAAYALMRTANAATLPYATGANTATGGGIQYNPQTGFSFALPTMGIADILGAGAPAQNTTLSRWDARTNRSRWTP